MNKINFCESCFEKQRKIDALTEEVKRLKQKLKYEANKTKEGYFGSSTPSSKQPFKENSVAKKEGGAKKGHKGNGRKSITDSAADRIEHLNIETGCPDCGKPLKKVSLVMIPKYLVLLVHWHHNLLKQCI
jgi:hypothetical protein